MELTPEQIIEAALKLPPADQVALADAIYLNTKAPWTEDVALSPEWDEEIGRRIKEIDEGKVKMIPWEDVEKQMREIIGDSD
ncbi:MAG: addiction module protein [Planctomycetota bacterium]